MKQGNQENEARNPASEIFATLRSSLYQLWNGIWRQRTAYDQLGGSRVDTMGRLLEGGLNTLYFTASGVCSCYARGCGGP